MKRLLLAIAAGVGLFLGGLAQPSIAADPPLPGQPNSDQFDCCVQYNKAQQELIQTGIWRWRFEVNPSCSGDVFPQVIDALNEISRTFGVWMQYDPVNGHLIYANCGPAFAGVCGSATAVIGCLGHNFPLNVDIDLNTTMAQFYPLSQMAIDLHELMHAMLTWNEQYTVSCLCEAPGWYDFMNTGVNSRHSFSYVELQRWARTAGPAPIKQYGSGVNGGGRYIFWGPTDSKTTRIAIMAWNPTTDVWRWTGVWAPTAPANSYQGWLVDDLLEPGEVACINPENAVSFIYGRNDICIP